MNSKIFISDEFIKDLENNPCFSNRCKILDQNMMNQLIEQVSNNTIVYISKIKQEYDFSGQLINQTYTKPLREIAFIDNGVEKNNFKDDREFYDKEVVGFFKSTSVVDINSKIYYTVGDKTYEFLVNDISPKYYEGEIKYIVARLKLDKGNNIGD